MRRHQLTAARDEADWARAAVASDFIQAEPLQGQPAVERTTVRVLFDARFLYFGVVCHDTNGGTGLRVRDLRRDFDETTDDFFGISIDGVVDGRSAMIFRVNPRGAFRDQQNVDGGLADVEFDAVWIARTSRDTGGWTAEIAIPWDTLRYKTGGDTWNINFQRMSRRRNESSGWSPWPRVMQPFRMDYAGRLTGLEPPPPEPQPASAAIRARATRADDRSLSRRRPHHPRHRAHRDTRRPAHRHECPDG